MKKKLFNLKLAALAIGIFFSATASATFTAVTSGNWSSATTWGGTAPTSTVVNQDIIIPSGITVTLDADLTFTGLLNTITVNGVLSSSSSNAISITQGALLGSGTIAINKISFMTTGVSGFLGNLNLKELRNSTSSLSFSAIANISDTLDLAAGNLLISTNGNLTMSSGSVVKVSSGSISLGAGVFNTSNAYSVLYTGGSKTAGIELNTVTLQNAYLNLSANTMSVSLSNNTIINGTLTLSVGKLTLNGKKLTIKGDLLLNPGTSLQGDAGADLSIEGTGPFTSPLAFNAGSALHDLTLNRASTVLKLVSPLSIAGHLNLIESGLSIENGGVLTMNALSTVHVEKGSLSLNSGTFTGISNYDVEYMGTTDVTSGVELAGSGLTNVTVNYANTANKVILSSNTIVSNKLSMIKGKIDMNGKMLTLNGVVSQSMNSSLIGNVNSELDLNLTTVSGDTLFFDTTDDASQSLNKLKVNNSGTTAIVIGTKLIITNELNFVKGKIELSNSDLIITPAASIVGYNDNRYVITAATATGALVMNVVSGSSYVIFPVGITADYSPAFVQQASGATSGNFSVRTNTFASMGLKLVNRNWFVESTVSSINVNLKFGWVLAAELNGFNRANAYVSHYSSLLWDVVSVGSATVAANNTFELSRNGITSLSPFAVVENGQLLKVAELSKTDDGTILYPNPAKDVINIKLIRTSDICHYELLDISGRLITSSSNGQNNELNVSKLETGSYFVKTTNLTQNTISTKRFIKD